LTWRLNVFPIHVPPLRDRPEDIEPPVRHFAQRFAARMRRRLIVPLEDLARQSFSSHGESPSTFVELERAYIIHVLEETNWIVGGARGAAARLGIKRTLSVVDEAARHHAARVIGCGSPEAKRDARTGCPCASAPRGRGVGCVVLGPVSENLAAPALYRSPSEALFDRSRPLAPWPNPGWILVSHQNRKKFDTGLPFRRARAAQSQSRQRRAIHVS
jgi:hypothetical protein